MSIDSCQNKKPADQCHMTISQAQMKSLRMFIRRRSRARWRLKKIYRSITTLQYERSISWSIDSCQNKLLSRIRLPPRPLRNTSIWVIWGRKTCLSSQMLLQFFLLCALTRLLSCNTFALLLRRTIEPFSCTYSFSTLS